MAEMAPPQPFIKDMLVEAKWDGDPTSPINLMVSFDLLAVTGSKLNLIDVDHPNVHSANVTDVQRFSSHGDARLRLISDSPPPSPVRRRSHRDSLTVMERKKYQRLSSGDMAEANLKQNANEELTSLEDKEKKPEEVSGLPLFSQTASLYDASSSPHRTASPPPPSEATKLTIRKRLSHGLSIVTSAPECQPASSKTVVDPSESSKSARKHPIPLEKRPPWRPLGADDTQRSRKLLETDMAKRRISRSAGPLRNSARRNRQRRSSVPEKWTKEQKLSDLRKVQDMTSFEQDKDEIATQDVATKTPTRDMTVKVTQHLDPYKMTQRLESWLLDPSKQWPTERSTLYDRAIAQGDLVSDLESEVSAPCLSPSPTPSSCAELPWTSTRSFLDAESKSHEKKGEQGEKLSTTILNDNGTLCIMFRRNGEVDSHMDRFRITFVAVIRTEALESGAICLGIPGLPTQAGDMTGKFNLIVTEVGEATGHSEVRDRPWFDNLMQQYSNFEKVAYLDQSFTPTRLTSGELSVSCRLDSRFEILFLCYKPCIYLGPKDFKIESRAYVHHDWEDSDEKRLVVETTLLCSIRLRPFLYWAETAMVRLYLSGGPTGKLITTMEPNNRRIDLDQEVCDEGTEAEHLEMSIEIQVDTIDQPFTFTWVNAFGDAPSMWLPQISVYPRQIHPILQDLPKNNGLLNKLASQASKVQQNGDSPGMVSEILSDDEFVLKSAGILAFRSESWGKRRHGSRLRRTSSVSLFDDKKKITFTSPMLRFEPRKRHRIGSAGFWCKKSENSQIYPVRSFNPRKRARTGQSLFGNRRYNVSLDTTHEHDHSKGVIGTDATQMASAASASRTWAAFRKSFALRTLVRLVALSLAMWIGFLVIERDTLVHYEESFYSGALDTWQWLNFEPVELYGDMTGWKHLLNRVSEGASRDEAEAGTEIIVKEKVGDVNESIDEAETGIEKRAVENGDEDAAGLKTQDDMKIANHDPETFTVNEEGMGTGSDSSDAGTHGASKTGGYWTVLDTIDRALGWQPQG